MGWSFVLAILSVLIILKSIVILLFPRQMRRLTLWFVKDEQRLKRTAIASSAVGILLGVFAVTCRALN